MLPALEDYGDEWVGFCDADMVWQADVNDLLRLIEPDKALMCVKHNHRPTEKTKMIGQIQTIYPRKNWSSLFLMKPSANQVLSPGYVNNTRGSDLHGFSWLDDNNIGDLPEAWNWLAGWSDLKIQPNVIHYTMGTPDMPGYQDQPYADEWRAALQDSGVRLAGFPQH